MNLNFSRYILFFLITLSFSHIHAQTVGDAVRYSLLNHGTTARNSAVGNAMGGIGADISVANSNPAGIAEFRRSELTLSLGVPLTSNEGTLRNQEGTNYTDEFSRRPLKLNNIGVVLANTPVHQSIQTFNFAIGINQQANFTEEIKYSGFSQGTRVERFLERANGNSPAEINSFDPWESALALETELILDENGDQVYESDFGSDLDPVLYREEDIQRSGQINEFYLSLASNVRNKFSWGVTLGFPILAYNETKRYLEEDRDDVVGFYFDHEFIQNLETTGGGFNIKAGLLYKVNKRLRLSMAMHSPSWMRLTDEFSTSLSFRSEEGDDNFANNNGSVSVFEYNLTTPWRGLLGASYLVRSGEVMGFLSAQAEYVNYSSSSFGGNNFDPVFAGIINTDLDNQLTSAININFGGEVAYSHWRGRLGATFLQSPYADSDLLSYDPILTAGIGYRADRFYIDLSYQFSSFDRQYTPYTLAAAEFENQVDVSTLSQIFGVTVGYKI